MLLSMLISFHQSIPQIQRNVEGLIKQAECGEFGDV
jgi:hypothetical protein